MVKLLPLAFVVGTATKRLTLQETKSVILTRLKE